MTPEFVNGFFFEAIKTAILLAAPMLLAGLAVGLLVGILQAATQIHEMTLTFIPKMMAVAAALIFFFPGWCRSWWSTCRPCATTSPTSCADRHPNHHPCPDNRRRRLPNSGFKATNRK